MQQGDAVVLLDSRLIAAQLRRQHGGVLRHTGGMAVRVGILHIDHLCEGLGDFTDQGHGFLVLLFQLLRAAADITVHNDHGGNQSDRNHQQHEPELLVELLFLFDNHADLFVAASQSVMDLHHVLIGAAAQVGVVHRNHFGTAYRIALSLETLQMTAHLGIAQRVVEDIGRYRQLLRACLDGVLSILIRIGAFSVHFDIRHTGLQFRDILIGLVDVDLAHSGAAGDVKVSVLRQTAVGVGGRNAGKSAVDAEIDGSQFPVVDQVLGRRHIDAVAGKDPDLAAFALVEVEVVCVREPGDRMYLIVGRHVCDCTAGDDPDHTAFGIELEAHDDIGGKALLDVDLAYAAVVDDIDSAAVAAEQDLTVQTFADREALEVLDSVSSSVAGDDGIVLYDVDSAGDSHQDGSVLALPYGTQAVGEQSVRLAEHGQVAVVQTNEVIGTPGADPEASPAVLDDGTYSAVSKLHKEISIVQSLSGGGPGALQGIGPDRTVVVQYHQTGIGTHEQQAVAHACGIDDRRLDRETVEQAGELVRNDLHHTLAGGGEPEVAQIVGHHMADVVVQRQIVQHRELPVLEDADSVSCTDPEPAADVFDALDVHQRRDLDDFGLRDLSGGEVDPDVVKVEVRTFHIVHAGILRIADECSGSSDLVVRDADVAEQLAVLDEKKVSEVRDAVDDTVHTPADIAHVGFGDLLVLHP